MTPRGLAKIWGLAQAAFGLLRQLVAASVVREATRRTN
jgi:hypothetical protein